MEKSSKPNIFFLLIDSFRADKCYGKDKTSITPNLDSLIQKGTIFTQTISSAPVTIPAVSCIFTGQYPFKAIIRGGNRAKLNPNVFNYVSHLKTSKYSTVAVVPKLLALSGLSNDFEEVIEYLGHDGLYDGVGDKILSVFEEKKLENPWFFYAHILDVHGTARGFPENFNDKKYGVNQYEKMVSAIDVWLGRIFKKIDLKNTLVVLTADHSSDAGVYTPEIESDKNNASHGHLTKSFKFGKKLSSKLPSPLKSKMKTIYVTKKNKIKTEEKNKVLEKINRKNLSPYEQRILEHSVKPAYDVFDDRFIVPLIFAGYGIKSNSVISQQVRTIDVFPTILDIAKISNDNIVEGKSISPLIEGHVLDETPAYLESIANWTKSDKTTNVVGIRYKNFKYFRSRDDQNENVGLYDLNIDPHEEYNIADKNPEKIIQMEKILTEIQTSIEDKSSMESDELRDLEEEKLVEAELKKLGYL